MNKIKVSIIVPVYNVEKFISRCLDSLINQTLKDIEIIVINDGTPDNSFDICKEYQKKDNRIKLFSKNNEGLGLTRNFGLKKAKGEFVAFIDSDDFIDLDFYERLYKNAIVNNVDAVYGNIRLYNNEGSILSTDCIPFEDNSIISSKSLLNNMLHIKVNDVVNNQFMGMSSVRSIYNRKIILENCIDFESERKYISEDLLFNLDFLNFSNSVSFIHDAYYYYCVNLNSLSHTYRQDRFDKSIVLFNELINRCKNYGIYENVKNGLSSIFIGYVRTAIRQEIFESNKKYNEISTFIKEILNDKNVVFALKTKNYENFKRFVFDYCLKIKCSFLVILIYKIFR